MLHRLVVHPNSSYKEYMCLIMCLGTHSCLGLMSCLPTMWHTCPPCHMHLPCYKHPLSHVGFMCCHFLHVTWALPRPCTIVYHATCHYVCTHCSITTYIVMLPQATRIHVCLCIYFIFIVQPSCCLKCCVPLSITTWPPITIYYCTCMHVHTHCPMSSLECWHHTMWIHVSSIQHHSSTVVMLHLVCGLLP